MIKKFLSFILCWLLTVSAGFTFVSAQTNTDDKDSSIEKVKAKIAARAINGNRRVEVKKLDGTKLKGDIGQADTDFFTLVDSKTNQTNTINYRDVAQVKNVSSTSNKIVFGIVFGAIAATAIVVGSLIAIRCRNEGGC